MIDLVSLALTHLRHEDAFVGDAVDPELARFAPQYLGIGLDHFSGERIVALVDESSVAEMSAKLGSLGKDAARHFAGVVVTDRRVIGGEPAMGIPLEAILGVQRGGVLVPDVRLRTTRGERKMDCGAADALAVFLRALLEVPPEHRVPPPSPLVAPTPEDPVGAESLYAEGVADPRTLTLIGVPMMSVRREGLPLPIAQDLAARAVLFERDAARGRGGVGKAWVSPLSPADFAHVVQLAFGGQMNQRWDAQGGLNLELTQRGSVAKAAASSMLGMAVGAAVGVGWSSAPSVKTIAFRIFDHGGYAAFTLKATSGAGYVGKGGGRDFALDQLVHDLLPPLEAQVLLLRSLYGWNTPCEQLMTASGEQVAERLESLMGVADLSAFLGDSSYDRMSAIDDIIDQVSRKSLDEHAADARAEWARASKTDDEHALFDAARSLQYVQLTDEALAAYDEIATRLPHLTGKCVRSQGDARLFEAEAAYDRPEVIVASCRDAITRYEQALTRGEEPAQVDENYWCTIELLAEHEPALAREWWSRYLMVFPRGEHRGEATRKVNH